MDKRPLGKTGLEIAPLVFGGNVFGWTADEPTSFELLDAWIDAGFNTIDTADVYSAWAPGNQGGESESVLGKWFKRSPSVREKVVLITKVGSELGPDKKGLSERWITQAVEDSLRRLQTDYIDLYLSHWPDPDTSFEETLGAYQKLLDAGKIRSIGASNLDAAQLKESLEVASREGLPRYEVLQPEYNLYDRGSYEGALSELCIERGIGVITYFSLASGFLSGKYRSKDDIKGTRREEFLGKYFDDRGLRILSALDQVSRKVEATPAEVALAWLIAKPGMTAPIVSATSRAQLDSLISSARLHLAPEDMATLDTASAS
ncbi:aldo/keto reductase [Halotalea alkalilenta]|uniref:aldo/keto reductase n=1 Tax=Halotalea alkalilenta TaxID=376489 RepID=UPI0004890CC8|nr:aldo/keto reductase [Halotalea alkalilenta]